MAKTKNNTTKKDNTTITSCTLPYQTKVNMQQRTKNVISRKAKYLGQ